MKNWIILTALLIVGCGGGSSETESSNSNEEITVPEIKITSEPEPIDRLNTPRLAAVVLDSLQMGQSIYSNWQNGDYLESFDLGITQRDCADGGSISLELNSARTQLIERYENCRLDGGEKYYSASGIVRTDFSGLDGQGRFSVKTIYRGFALLGDDGESEFFDAVLNFSGSADAPEGFYPSVSISVEAKNSFDGEFKISRLSFVIYRGDEFQHYLGGVLVEGGEIEYSTVGVASIRNGTLNSFDLIGDSLDKGVVGILGSDVRIEFTSNVDVDHSAALRTPVWTLDKVSFHRAVEAPPVRRPDREPYGYEFLFVEGEPATIPALEYFLHEGGQLLDLEITVDRILPQNMSGGESDKFSIPDYRIEEVRVGEFHVELTERMQNDEVLFLLSVSAKDTQGRGSEEKVSFPVTFFRDTDGDGIHDIDDWDDDNDGVHDSDDAFPKDPSESSDFDGDGMGDNTDKDDDGDGVEDSADAYPLDPLCHVESDGNGESCLLREMTRQRFIDRNGVVMFYDQYKGVIYRWDSTTRHFIESVELKSSDDEYARRPEVLHYSPEHHVLYVLYKSEGLYRIDFNLAPLQEMLFIKWSDFVGEFALSYTLETTDDFIVASGRTARGGEYRLFDIGGQYLDTFQERSSEQMQRNYYRPFPVAPFCEVGVAVNADLAAFYDLSGGDLTEGLVPDDEPESDQCFEMQSQNNVFPFVSPDGNAAIVANGSIVDRSGDRVGLNNIQFVVRGQVFWNKAGIFSLNRDEGRITHYDSGGNFVEEVQVQRLDEAVGNTDHLIWFDGVIPEVVDLNAPSPLLRRDEN